MTGVARIVVNGSPRAFAITGAEPETAEANGAFSSAETNE